MLKVHFLNVGQGDCTLIEHPSGRLTMIDINNSQDYDNESLREFTNEWKTKKRATERADGLLWEILADGRAKEDARHELTDPVEFMQRRYPGRNLFRFILTHPDMDHMRGLKRLHDTIGFHNFWDTSHTKTIPQFRSEADEEDWNLYHHIRPGNTGIGTHHFRRGMQHFAFAQEQDGTPGGDGIEIISPTPELIASCNAAEKSNDLSYVLRIRHAGRTLLLPGDAEEEAWNDIQRVYGAYLKSDFLKASHHGRDSGYHLDTVQLIQPQTVVVSVGRKPPTDASCKYRDQCGHVMSTRYYGNIELHINDDGSYEWFVDRNAGNP